MPPAEPIRLTFETEPQQVVLDLWYRHIPVAGETVVLGHSEWTVIRIDYEVVEWKGTLHTLTRYVIGDERPIAES